MQNSQNGTLLVNCCPLVLVFQLFRNLGGGGGTGSIGEDDYRGWVCAEEEDGFELISEAAYK